MTKNETIKNYLLFALAVAVLVAGFILDGVLFGSIPEYMLF